MKNERCCNCDIKAEYTTQPDKTKWCKKCYDDGVIALGKGLFTHQEYKNHLGFMKIYNHKQKEIVRELFKVGQKAERDYKKAIELTTRFIDALKMVEDTIALEKYKMIRSELIKYPEKHYAVLLEIIPEIPNIIDVSNEYYNQAVSTIKLELESGGKLLDMLQLYHRYNGNIV